MKALGLPILPLKFLFAVDITFSLSAGIPSWVPTQGPQPGATTADPALIKVPDKSLLRPEQL